MLLSAPFFALSAPVGLTLTANIYTHLKSEMMKKSSVDMEEVFRRKQEAKSALAKAQTTRDKRSRKPVLDMSLPWAGKF